MLIGIITLYPSKWAREPQYDRSVVLNLGSIALWGFIWEYEEEKKHILFFSNHEGFDECMYGTCGVQGLQLG